jgi:hypothetical protein
MDDDINRDSREMYEHQVNCILCEMKGKEGKISDG